MIIIIVNCIIIKMLNCVTVSDEATLICNVLYTEMLGKIK